MSGFYKKNKTIFSFEVFPCNDNCPVEKTIGVLDRLAKLNPEFISVTYGAAGSRVNESIKIASHVQNSLNIPALAHLTCVRYKESELLEICKELKDNNINNILALRGDRPNNMTDEEYNNRDFIYADSMIKCLNKNTDFNIAAAAYPEKHFEARSLEEDISNLKEKVNSGVDFLITQLFFDNDYFYRFQEILDKNNIKVPVSCGIMPITSAKQLSTTISLSGSSVPKKLADIIAKYGDNTADMNKAGIDFAVTQINDLIAKKVDGIHLYTMNRPKTSEEIMKNIQ